jgi:type VI secretion system FHA domain protein
LTLHEQISEPFSGQIPDLHQALKPRQLISDDWDAPPNEPDDSAKNYVDLQRNHPSLEPHTATRGAADGAEDSLVAAFLAGVAMEDAALRDPRETLKRAGAALRATVSGLRAALIALDLIRGEFRIERTEIQASGNNPLKFSTSDDDTIAGFLGAGRNTMSPADAISKTLRSVRQHELATMTAMQSAAAALLAQFDPATLLRQTEQAGFAVLPGQHKVRAWDAFATAHARVSQSLSDNFDSVFARAFARAYEQTIDELSAQQDPP